MTFLFAIITLVHGLIHLLGAAKAFGVAELPQLTKPVSPLAGAGWLLAALLFVTAVVALFIGARWWWMVAASAVVISFLVIVPSWDDARFGVAGNLIVLTGVVFGFLAHGPASLEAEYRRDVTRALAHASASALVTEADLRPLPAAVQRYLRVTGAVGQPRVGNFRVRMRGRIRNDANSRWMPLTTEQYNFVEPPARLFYLNAAMFALPIQGYHRYLGESATMRVKAAALVPVVDASGSIMTQSETVTLFNDMCFLAPATLIDPRIVWERADAHSVVARFSHAGHAIRATLSFNDAGELTDFWSDDRYRTGADGKTLEQLRWSTPLGTYRAFGRARLASTGEARWHAPDGEYAYIELTVDDVQVNLSPR